MYVDGFQASFTKQVQKFYLDCNRAYNVIIKTKPFVYV